MASKSELHNESHLQAPKLLHEVSEKAQNTEESSLDSPAPEGGLRAWLVAGGAAALFFCTLGFANSFGVFQEYYLSHQMKGESASKVAWIGSLSMFLQFFAGMIGGPLFDRYGEKVRALSCISLPFPN